MANTNLSHIYFGRPGDEGEPFSRVNEAVNTEKLRPGELVTLDNMRLDEEIGAATTRKGFNRYYNQVDTTGKINSIYDVNDLNDNNYLLAQIGTKLRKSLDGSVAYSDVKTGLTNAKLRMAVYGDKFYFTNNNEKPFYTDLTNTYNMEIARPDVSSTTLTDSGVGSADIFIYTYIIVFLTKDGMKSNPSIKLSIRAYYQIDIALANIPVSSDTRVISKMIFRTKALANSTDISNTFYLAATIDNSVTSYNDTLADDSLDQTEPLEYINIPEKAKYIIANNERLVLASFTKLATNRVIPPPHIFIYTSGSLEEWVADDTQAGNLSAGDYSYAISFVDSSGNESELVPLFSHTLASGSKKIIYNIGYSFACLITGSTVTGYFYLDNNKYLRLYRTKANGSTYFYVKDYTTDYTTLTDTDDLADASLTIEYPKSENSYTEELTLKTSIVVTNLYKPLEFPELNFIDIYPDDSDEIIGIFDDDNGFMIFKQKSICKLYTIGDVTNWSVKKIVENMGCDEPESIYKRGNSYFFMYQKRPYFFNGGPQPENIGETRKNTFDLVTEVTGSTFWNEGQWYILSVKIGVAYYLLCYDTKLQGWYKFSISKADVVTKKEYGSDAGKILIGGNLYVTYYNENAISDSDSGVAANIGILLKTRDCTADNFVMMRLFKLSLNYQSLGTTISKTILSKLTDPANSTNRYYLDIDNSYTENNFELINDAMLGTLQRTQKVNLTMSGFGVKKIYAARLDYYPEPWNVLKRYPAAIEGFGMQQGTKAGVND